MESRTLFYGLLLGVLWLPSGTYAQENAQRSISPSLLECYEKWYLVGREKGPPHTLSVLLAILRKIENTQGPQMNLRGLSVALLHRFRQDGIIENPKIASSDGVTPYAPIGFQFHRHARTLRLIPGNSLLFPNDSVNAMERCTLHTMLSSSIAIFRRADEGTTCKFPRSSSAASYYMRRKIRDISADGNANANANANVADGDVETLTSGEIAAMERKGNKESAPVEDGATDPNSVYPELPPNHPNNERLSQPLPRSECPLEDGVIKTPWADVAGGPLLAGIAAALESQTISLGDLFREDNDQRFGEGSDDGSFLRDNALAASVILNNKWFATLAGDLAEVALLQGPSGEALSVGANGTWNSTVEPRWYFLHSNGNLSMTTAEIRGDLDGLILAQHVADLQSNVPNIRLSQILDMYYSTRGLVNGKVRACDRRKLFTSVAPNDTMSAQAYVAALLLKEDLARATLKPSAVERFAVEAAARLAAYIPSSMNNDQPCPEGNPDENSNYPEGNSLDLTVILDTSWPFPTIRRILGALLEEVDINPFASSLTVMNGFDGKLMINTSYSILDFYEYNETHYTNVSKGFDLAHSLDALASMRTRKLEEEREHSTAGGNSDVVLIVPYKTTISTTDREYCTERLKRLHEESPDTTVLVLTRGSKDTWSNFVLDASKDLFSVGAGDVGDPLGPAPGVRRMADRMRKVPKRLVNTQCGADYVARGSSSSFVDYVRRSITNSYRIHPNYFFATDYSNVPTIKIQAAPGWGTLRVCSSRDFSAISTVNSSSSGGASCATIKENAESVTVSCADANYIHECPPLYLSVMAIDTTDGDTVYRCTDPTVCRFPDAVKYTISYENLLCASNASTIVIDCMLLFLAVLYYSTR